MAETSLPWSGTSIGDAGPYSDDTWSDMYRKLFITDRTTQGVLDGYANEIEITGATSPVSVNTGAALVDGKFYENDSSANITVPTPSGDTRIDRIVLRKSWSAQTVRLTRIEGVEGGGVPALTQNDGVTWDIPLYQVSITTGGNITLTDERSFIVPNFEADVGRDPSPTFAADVDINDNDLDNIKQANMTDEHDNGNSGNADTIDWREGNNQKSNLTDDCTFTFTAPDGPCHLQLKLTQGAGFPHTATWPGTVKWARGIAPTLSTGDGEIDIVYFWYDGTNYYGTYAIDFS